MNRSTLNHFKTAMLFAVPAAVTGAIGYAVAGRLGLMLCAAAYTLLATIVFLYAERMVLKQHDAEYIPESQAPGLYAIANELARRAGAPRPRLYLLPAAAPEMLVTGRTAQRGAIGLSKGLTDLLSTEELAAVIAHAIHHLRSGETRPMTMAAGLVGVLIFVSKLFRWRNLLGPKMVKPEIRGGVASDAFLWALIAPIGAALVRGTVYPSRQYRADAASAHFIGDTNPLCTALEKIEAYTPGAAPDDVSPSTAHLFLCRPVLRNGGMDLFRTHPPMTKRIRKLEALGQVINYFQLVMKPSLSEQIEPKIFREERTNI